MPVNITPTNLTEWEWESLDNGYNLADGHAHQPQDKQFLKIVNSLPELFLKAEASNQIHVQELFAKAFFEHAGQISYAKLSPPLYFTSCSQSIEAVANYLRMTNKSVALLHPTFDNIADIFKRHGVRLTALEEDVLNNKKSISKIKSDAIFLVCPNNPTGTEISRSSFNSIVNFCRSNKKILIVDYSFRFYSNFTTWDQYSVLIKSGIDFITLEDTGKTWPTLDFKIGIALASQKIYKKLGLIADDFLLNVSPFAFVLSTEYINVSKRQKYPKYRSNVEVNKQKLKDLLQKSGLKITNNSKLSVAWIKLPKGWQATELCSWLGKRGVHVLPGSPFFWNDPSQGEEYIRIALQRPQELFLEGAKNCVSLLKSYTPESNS